METILIILATGFICLLSFYMGLKAGNKEEIKIPTICKINPVKKYQEYKENKEQKLEQKIFETNLENIDIYDGTGLGQKDIPR